MFFLSFEAAEKSETKDYMFESLKTPVYVKQKIQKPHSCA